MKKIGITGSIGSGKSTVSNIFAALGIPVYDADLRAKSLMIYNTSLVNGIKQLLGSEAYLPSGELNKTYIASIAFHDTSVLAQLNALVHPAVFGDFDNWCTQQKTPYVLKEAALMFESDSYKQLDEVIVVTAPEGLRIKRTMNRDGISKNAVLSRMNNQLSQEEKLARGQHEIRNNELELLIPQVISLHHQLKGYS
jgi:dephospho-CoA kinase